MDVDQYEYDRLLRGTSQAEIDILDNLADNIIIAMRLDEKNKKLQQAKELEKKRFELKQIEEAIKDSIQKKMSSKGSNATPSPHRYLSMMISKARDKTTVSSFQITKQPVPSELGTINEDDDTLSTLPLIHGDLNSPLSMNEKEMKIMKKFDPS